MLEKSDKKDNLGIDRMGYQSKHFVVKLINVLEIGDYSKCEIQIRTSLQNAWADLSHTLVYKNTEDDKYNIARKINNISSALEVIQDQVDSIRRGMQKEYQESSAIKKEASAFSKLLGREIKPGLLARYCSNKFSEFVVKGAKMDMVLLNRAVLDLPDNEFNTIGDIDNVVNSTLNDVLLYK